MIKTTAFASLAGSFLAAGNAQAAMEVANLAASDNRGGLFLTLALPVLGWVSPSRRAPLPGRGLNPGGGRGADRA